LEILVIAVGSRENLLDYLPDGVSADWKASLARKQQIRLLEFRIVLKPIEDPWDGS
jgi:hypothetical protein